MPPAPGTGIPPWQQIGGSSNTIVAGNLEQAMFWHEVGTAASELTNQFTFTYINTTTSTAISARGMAAGFTYSNTCLQNGSDAGGPCTSPILDFNSGSSSSLTNTVTQSNTSNLGEPGGEIQVPANGRAVGGFSSSDVFSYFGESNSTTCNSNGGTCPSSAGHIGLGMSATGLAPPLNGGISITDKVENTAGTDGPFVGTLPDRFDPTGSITINQIMGGTPASGTTTSPVGYIGMLQAYIQGDTGGTPPGGFNTTTGGGVTVPITSDGGSDWTYSNPTTGTGTGGNLFLQDPVLGVAISQSASIIGFTP